MSRVLAFSCIHFPFAKKGAIEFLKEAYRRYKCDTVVCLGDEIDCHRISFHEPEPEAMGAKEELEKALKDLKKLYKAFPKVKVCLSNHTSRPFRLAAKAGIPEVFLKHYREFLEAPKGWEWDQEWHIDDVTYMHGEGFEGMVPHLNAVKKRMESVVIGHYHRAAGVEYLANHKERIFGMCVGCLIDEKAYAFRYAKNTATKSMISCGIVLDGKEAIVVPMELGKKVWKVW